MNCEVCVQKFKDIESLIKHEASECHQENVKHQNALLDYSAKEVPAISGDIPVTAAESVIVAAENDEVATESNPVIAEVALEANESVPVAAESVSLASEVVPIAADAAPIVFNDNLFSCTACSIGFSNISNAMQHSESMLHAIMVLATGIGFEEQVDICEDYTDSFPVLYYCIVCNFYCFASKLYDVHLKTRIHRRIVQRMSNLFKGKGENATDVCLSEQTFNNNSKLPVQHYCKLCNIQFKNTKCYRRHLKGKKHQRILPLIKKMAQGRKENVGTRFNSKEIENSNTSQYYCELCNISVNSNTHEKHLKWMTHKRVEQYINTISCGIDIDIFDDSDFKECYNDRSRLYYCEICNIWCFGTKCYENHLNGKKHCRKTGQKRIDADPKSADNINDSSPSSHLCELCNFRCANSKRFKKHMKSKVHIRVGQIMSELSKMKDDVGSCFDAHGDTDESSHLPYYCKLCDVLCSCPKSYDCHLKGKTHKGIKRIVSTLSNETS